MNSPRKEIEVGLKDIGCPYSTDNELTLVWLDGYRKGQADGMDAGAKVVSEVYDRAIAGDAA